MMLCIPSIVEERYTNSPKHRGRYIPIGDIYYFSQAMFLPDLIGGKQYVIASICWVSEMILDVAWS